MANNELMSFRQRAPPDYAKMHKLKLFLTHVLPMVEAALRNTMMKEPCLSVIDSEILLQENLIHLSLTF